MVVERRVNEEVWEECILPESKTPQLAEAQGMISLALSTIQEGVQVRVQVEVGREEQGAGETHGESQNEETTRNKRSTAHHGWHEYGVMRAARTHSVARLEPCGVIHIIKRV